MSDPPDARTPPHPPDGDRTIIDWSPSSVVAAMWVAMSITAGLLGLFLFGLVYALAGPTTPDAGLELIAPVAAALAVAVLILHQLIHAAIARVFGGTPRFDVVQWIFPVIYVRSTGRRVEKRQYTTYLLAPLVVLSLTGLAGILIVPLALNAGMATRDLWTAWIIWRQPGEVEVEEWENGLRLHLPGNTERQTSATRD